MAVILERESFLRPVLLTIQHSFLYLKASDSLCVATEPTPFRGTENLFCRNAQALNGHFRQRLSNHAQVSTHVISPDSNSHCTQGDEGRGEASLAVLSLVLSDHS